MIADYPTIVLIVIYIGLYYLALKTVFKQNIARKKRLYLLAVIFLLPFVGVFVPLFMFSEEDPNDFFYGVEADNSDKIELNNSIDSHDGNGHNFD